MSRFSYNYISDPGRNSHHLKYAMLEYTDHMIYPGSGQSGPGIHFRTTSGVSFPLFIGYFEDITSTWQHLDLEVPKGHDVQITFTRWNQRFLDFFYFEISLIESVVGSKWNLTDLNYLVQETTLTFSFADQRDAAAYALMTSA